MIFICIFICGTVLASFIVACSYRLVNHYSLLHPVKSVCDHCCHSLAWWQLIPIISFCLLRGRCHYCHQKISSFLPIIELLTGLSFASLIIFDLRHDLLVSIFLASLVFLTATDFFGQVIYFPALLGLFSAALLSIPQDYLVNLCFACLLILALSLFTALTHTLGSGDIEFLFIVCLIWGWYQALIIIQISSVLMLAIFYYSKQRKLPFVPALSLASLLSLFMQGC